MFVVFTPQFVRGDECLSRIRTFQEHNGETRCREVEETAHIVREEV